MPTRRLLGIQEVEVIRALKLVPWSRRRRFRERGWIENSLATSASAVSA